MELLHELNPDAACRGGYLAIGNFDGVHLGHQEMIATLVRRSRAANVPAVVFTFNPHPIRLLRPEHTPPNLSTLRRKTELFERHGVDCTIAYPTDLELLSLAPRDFFDRVVIDALDARGLVEGPNFCFGRNRAGNVHTLKELCENHGRSLDVVEPVELDGEMVSSSVVRDAIQTGNVDNAVRLLGHPYRIEGRVVRGDGRGCGLGFPTANLADVETLLPADGVYAGFAEVDGTRYSAAVNLGPNPTFADDRKKLEAHLIGFDGDLYDERLDLDLLSRIRDTRRFASPDELTQQLRVDVAAAQSVADLHIGR